MLKNKLISYYEVLQFKPRRAMNITISIIAAQRFFEAFH